MSNEVLVDALPYIDTGYEEPGVREAALAMVEEETKEYRPTKNYLEHLPPLQLHAFETDILKGEFERMASRQPMDQLPMKRYELPHPPAGKMTDPAAWNECVDNSMAQLQHQFTRITNLDLMLEFSCEAWKSYLMTLTNMLAVAQRRLQGEKKNVQELNWQRKSTQTSAGDQIKKLEADWVGLVSKNFEIESECLKLQRKIEELKKEGIPPRPIKRKKSLENGVPVAELKKKFRKIEEPEKSPEYEQRVPVARHRSPPRRRYMEDSDEEEFVDKDDLRKYDLAGTVSDEEAEDERRANSEERDEERYDRRRDTHERREEQEEEDEHEEKQGREERREEEKDEDERKARREDREERDDRQEERDDRREDSWQEKRRERDDRREERDDRREDSWQEKRRERDDRREERDERREDSWQEKRRERERWDERREDEEERRRYSSSSSSGSESESEKEGDGDAMDLENTDSE